MRITRQQLRGIIEAFTPQSTRPSGPDYVTDMLKNTAVTTGESFRDIAMDGVVSGNYQAAAGAIMDALWVDDPLDEDEAALEDMLATVEPQNFAELATVGAEWLDNFRVGAYHR